MPPYCYETPQLQTNVDSSDSSLISTKTETHSKVLDCPIKISNCFNGKIQSKTYPLKQFSSRTNGADPMIPFLRFLIESLNYLLVRNNLIILMVLSWLVILTLVVIFSFISPWPTFLPLIFLAFTLGYLSSSLSENLKRPSEIAKKGKNLLAHLDKLELELETDLRETKRFKKGKASTSGKTKESFSRLKSVELKNSEENYSSPISNLEAVSTKIFASPVSDESTNLIKVPTIDSPFPPSSTWLYPPLYLRFVEQKWVLDALNSQTKRKGIKSWRMPDVKVDYPTGPLKIKGNSNIESDYINYFETPYFKGKMLIRVNHLQDNTDHSYFSGKKRTTQTCIQGKFKHPYKFNEVLTGQIFEHRFINLPPFWLVKLGFLIVRRLSPNMQVDIINEQPFALSPLITATQSLHIADGNSIRPPDISLKETLEDTTLLGGSFSKKRIPKAERKSYFRDLKNLSKFHFETDYTYTFDFYQHIFFPSSYQFNIGVYNLDLSPYLNGQPIETMALIDKKMFKSPGHSSEETQTDSSDTEIDDTNSNETPENSPRGGLGRFFDTSKYSSQQSINTTDLKKKKRCFLWRIQMIHENLLKTPDDLNQDTI